MEFWFAPLITTSMWTWGGKKSEANGIRSSPTLQDLMAV